jgi:hypothetical protein
MTKENVVVANNLFDISTLDVNKFMDVVRITSYIIQDTGLHMTGVRFDGGVVGFGQPRSEEDYISYNLQHNLLFLNEETLTRAQYRSAIGIATLFDLTVKEFPDA